MEVCDTVLLKISTLAGISCCRVLFKHTADCLTVFPWGADFLW